MANARSIERPEGTLAVFPGSFDPITLGHLDIIGRAAKCFDHLIVVITLNPSKKGMFNASERTDLVRNALSVRYPELSEAISVHTCEGLLSDFVKRWHADAIIKGLRSVSDYEYEYPMAHMNKSLSGVDTFFLLTDSAYSFISSTLIKEVAQLEGEITQWVTPEVAQALSQKVNPKYQA